MKSKMVWVIFTVMVAMTACGKKAPPKPIKKTQLNLPQATLEIFGSTPNLPVSL